MLSGQLGLQDLTGASLELLFIANGPLGTRSFDFVALLLVGLFRLAEALIFFWPLGVLGLELLKLQGGLLFIELGLEKFQVQ